MSRRSRYGVPLLVLVAGSASTQNATATAQQPTEQELVARIESLMPAYLEARLAWDERLRAQIEEANTRTTPSDTVQVGPLRIVTLPGDAETAAELFEEVWREDFGSVPESPALRDFTFAFQWRARLRDFELPSRISDRVLRVEMSRLWAPTREMAKAHVRSAVVRVMSQDLPPGSPLRGVSTAIGYSDDATVYRLMAVTPSGATRACLSGDVGACLAALGMGFGGAADELPGWFTPEQRREMVFAADMFQRGREGVGGRTPRVDGDDPLVRRCVEASDASACDQVLASLEWVSSVPTSSDIRSHLFWYAVRAGGEGAWARTLERAEAPIPELLEHVAGLPLEELAGRWRSRLIESRPDVHAGLGTTQLTVLVWALIFAALAMRSTRWRLG